MWDILHMSDQIAMITGLTRQDSMLKGSSTPAPYHLDDDPDFYFL
jgi:hypothetical protein